MYCSQNINETESGYASFSGSPLIFILHAIKFAYKCLFCNPTSKNSVKDFIQKTFMLHEYFKSSRTIGKRKVQKWSVFLDQNTQILFQ